ncbi:MAG: hypothetical protein KAH23_06145 [Kiritimatiellae bacterium]|nr:hypothetical protein [Kiritimatiellia bacterium]
MKRLMEHTCWRGVELDLPADWEMTFASPAGKPGGCTFADRRYERLKLQWRTLKYKPNLDKLVEKNADNDREGEKTSAMTGQSAGWQGLVTEIGDKTIVHAGKFLPENKMLLEAIIMWPYGRNRRLENKILSSMKSSKNNTPTQSWQAMGIRMKIARDLDLLNFKSEAGNVTWKFGEKETKPGVTVRRIGVPKYWLNRSLEEWLCSTLDLESTVAVRRTAVFNRHPGASVTSTRHARNWDRIRGKRLLDLDIAWRCPTEDHVYHISYSEVSKGFEINMPDHVGVECCKEYALAPSGEQAERRGYKERNDGRDISD